jgi:hypothetical protein
MEWKGLEDIDFYAMREELMRVGIRCKNEEMVDNFIEQTKMGIESAGGKFLIITYTDCSSSEDYQRRIVDGVSSFIRDEFPSKAAELGGADLSAEAMSCLSLLERVSNELRGRFGFAIDFRGIKITPSILLPGREFWWVYDAATRCVNSSLVWIMDDDEEGAERLIKHGQMRRVFSEDGTSTFLIL